VHSPIQQNETSLTRVCSNNRRRREQPALKNVVGTQLASSPLLRGKADVDYCHMNLWLARAMPSARLKRLLRLRKSITEILPTMIALPGAREAVKMPIKRPVVTEMDLLRARQIVCSLIPLKRLSSDDAEIVARAIAEGIAVGRKQRLEMAKLDLEA
jgi:hypothetical protein